jgi:Domain of unknown function (DUF1877)
MSMTAQFVQISSGQLAALIEDPDNVEELFSSPGVAAMATPKFAALSEAQRQHIIADGPRALEGALAGLAPRTREQLSARLGQLGIDVAALGKGAGGEALLNLLMARAGGGSAGGAGQGASSARGASISIDKSWHGIHYLLCGAAQPTSAIVSQSIMGGTDVGDDFAGYGAARYFTVAETAAIAAELNRATLETEMTRRYDPAQMKKLEIYPGGWTGPDAQWLMREFGNLRAFYADASTKGLAMLTCLV